MDNLYRPLMDPATTIQAKYNGPNALYATVVKPLVCPSDTFPAGPSVQLLDPSRTYPDGDYLALASYGANWGTRVVVLPFVKDGVFSYNTMSKITDISDGTSSTVLFGERSFFEPRWSQFLPAPPGMPPAVTQYSFWGWWVSAGGLGSTSVVPLVQIIFRLPANLPKVGTAAWIALLYQRINAFGSSHPGGRNIAFADGSVHFVSDGLDQITLEALCTKSGSEVIVSNY